MSIYLEFQDHLKTSFQFPNWISEYEFTKEQHDHRPEFPFLVHTVEIKKNPFVARIEITKRIRDEYWQGIKFSFIQGMEDFGQKQLLSFFDDRSDFKATEDEVAYLPTEHSYTLLTVKDGEFHFTWPSTP